MRIIIEYDSIWKNSFLDGSNACKLPKKGRKYIASGASLNKKSFTERQITHNTVMGVLSRLIGDQRKLYQARASDNYYFKELENKITFIDTPEQCSFEIVFLRNISGNLDKNGSAGEISIPKEIFDSEVARQLWAVLWLSIDELYTFICNDVLKLKSERIFAPLLIEERLKEIKCIKKNEFQKTNGYLEATQKVTEVFSEAYSTADKNNPSERVNLPLEKTTLENLYCSALYIQLERLKKRFDVSALLTSKGGIGGFSKRLCTIKDFKGKYTNKKKPVYGNPFLFKQKVKGIGQQTFTLKKASGNLSILIDVDSNKGQELKQFIENAGVSAFSLGKKGLAYVSKITT